MRKRKQLNKVRITHSNATETNNGHSSMETQQETVEPQIQQEIEHSDGHEAENSQPSQSSTAVEQPNIQDQEFVVRTTRGPTRLLDVWDLEEGEKIIVKFNVLHKPIGLEGGKFNQFLGSMIRKPEFAPLNYTDWKKFPKHLKEHMWKIVEEKFHMEPLTDDVKKSVISEMGDKWRRWKSDVKAKSKFDCNLSAEENLARFNLDRVNKEHYKALVDYWLTEKAKEQSQKNSENRSNVKHNHRGGTKSLARRIQEEVEKTGIPPSRGKLFIDTRKRKDGTYKSQYTAEIAGQIEEKMAQTDKVESALDPKSWDDDSLAQVIGPNKRGRVSGLGRVYVTTNKKDAQINELRQENSLLLGKLNTCLDRLERYGTLLQHHFRNMDGCNDNATTSNSQVRNAQTSPNESFEGLRPSSMSSAYANEFDEE